MAKTAPKKNDIPEETAPKPRRSKKNQSPLATEEHLITTKFTVQKPVEELKPKQPPPAPARERAPDDSDDDEELAETITEDDGDEVEQFLSTIDTRSAEWTMIVYRLPNYELDGRTDSRSGRIRLGSRPFNPKTYEDEIAARYAKPGLPNIFLVEIRRDGDYHTQLPVLFIEPASPEELARFGVTAATPNPAPAIAPATAVMPTLPMSNSLEEQLAAFSKFLELGQKLSKIFMPVQPQTAPVMAPAEPPSEERALMTLLMSDENTTARVRSAVIDKLGLGGTSGGETNWADVINTFLQKGPEMLQVGLNWVERMRQQAAFDVHNPQPAQFPPTAPTAPTAPLSPEEALFEQVLRMCRMGIPAPAAAANLSQMIAAHTYATPDGGEYCPLDMAVAMFLTMTPAQAIEAVTSLSPANAELVQQPHVPQWIAEIQAALKAEVADYETGDADTSVA